MPWWPRSRARVTRSLRMADAVTQTATSPTSLDFTVEGMTCGVVRDPSSTDPGQTARCRIRACQLRHVGCPRGARRPASGSRRAVRRGRADRLPANTNRLDHAARRRRRGGRGRKSVATSGDRGLATGAGGGLFGDVPGRCARNRGCTGSNSSSPHPSSSMSAGHSCVETRAGPATARPTWTP